MSSSSSENTPETKQYDVVIVNDDNADNRIMYNLMKCLENIYHKQAKKLTRISPAILGW